MQTITTKFIGPTSTRGARIKATSCSGQTLTISYDHALNSDCAHSQAAMALAKKLNWAGKYVVGSTVFGYVFVPATNVMVNS